MTNSLLNAVKGKAQEARQAEATESRQARQRYEEMLADSIAGKEIDPDEALAIIAAAGHTCEDFERHIGILEEHERNKAIVATGADWNRRNDEHIAAAKKLDEEREAFDAEQKKKREVGQRAYDRLQVELHPIKAAERAVAEFKGIYGAEPEASAVKVLASSEVFATRAELDSLPFGSTPFEKREPAPPAAPPKPREYPSF